MIVPPITRSPFSLVIGIDSPVTIDSSIDERPSITIPSTRESFARPHAEMIADDDLVECNLLVRSVTPDPPRASRGHLARKPDGAWFFCDAEGDSDDEAGFRFNDEHFVPGEYVSLREQDGKMHTFRVVSVEAP